MLLTNNLKKNLSYFEISLACGILSFIISLLPLINSDLPNTDGILYLRGADAFITSGLSAASSIYPNPFYSALIGATSLIFSLGTIVTSHILNAILCGIIGYNIVAITALMTKNINACILSGFLFLLHPTFNEYREYIIRDFGFWAGALIFLKSQIEFNLHIRLQHVIVGILGILLGAMFRIESFFLLLIPLINIIRFRKHYTLCRNLAIYFIPSTILLSAVFFIIFNVSNIEIQNSIEHGSTLQLKNIFTIRETLNTLITNFNAYILSGYMEEFTPFTLTGAMLTLLIAKLISSLSIAYIILLIIVRNSIVSLRFSAVRINAITSSIAIYFLVIFLYLFATRVLQGRHVLLPIILLFPFMGIWLDHWLTHARRYSSNSLQKRRLIIGGFCLYLFLDSFVSFGNKKTYLLEAVNWSKETISQECSVISNNKKLAYFSGGNVNWKITDAWSNTNSRYRFRWSKNIDVTIREYRNGKELPNTINMYGFTVFKKFSDNKGNGVEIILNPNLSPNCLIGR